MGSSLTRAMAHQLFAQLDMKGFLPECVLD